MVINEDLAKEIGLEGRLCTAMYLSSYARTFIKIVLRDARLKARSIQPSYQ